MTPKIGMLSLQSCSMKVLLQILLLTLVILEAAFCASKSPPPRGVAPEEEPFYRPSKTFSCRDNSKRIPYSFVNDGNCSPLFLKVFSRCVLSLSLSLCVCVCVFLSVSFFSSLSLSCCTGWPHIHVTKNPRWYIIWVI